MKNTRLIAYLVALACGLLLSTANAGILDDLIRGPKQTLVGDDVKNADALSNEVQIRIFDAHGRPGEQYDFTVIVQNESRKVARDLTVYVRPPMTLKSTKLQPVAELAPGKSERWDLTATAPRATGNHVMKARVIWGGGLYNDHQATLKVTK